MQKISKLYRSNYEGEQIVRELILDHGAWNRSDEFVPNNVINLQISNRALVIGNGISRKSLYPKGDLLKLIKNHRGGLMASGAFQTYGCNALYREFKPDFLVANGPGMISEIAMSGYCDANIVYSNSEAVLDYPGKFYLTPQNPHYDSGATAAYLACFDGHKKVYLMGFDGTSGEGNNYYNAYAGTSNYPKTSDPSTEAFTEKTMKHVMTAYSDVEFIRVVPTKGYYMPESWKYQINLRQITFRDFVLEVDL